MDTVSGVYHRYDVYGFVIAVDGPAKDCFEKEYGRLRTNSTCIKSADLYVRPANKKELPTKPLGSNKGMYLPFREGENTLWYNPGVDPYSLLSYCEGLITWDDKAFLHASAVSKAGEAFLFAGGEFVGKTSMVISFLEGGYDFLGDDWVIIGAGKAFPFPKRLHIFDHDLKDKQVAKKVLNSKRFPFRLLFSLLHFADKITPHRYIRFAVQTLTPHFRIDIKELYPHSAVGSSSHVSKVFYLERCDNRVIELEEVKLEELARRMSYVHLHERIQFLSECFKYAFRFDITNNRIERQFSHDMKIMSETFRAAKLFKLSVPYGTDLTTIDISFFERA